MDIYASNTDIVTIFNSTASSPVILNQQNCLNQFLSNNTSNSSRVLRFLQNNTANSSSNMTNVTFSNTMTNQSCLPSMSNQCSSNFINQCSSSNLFTLINSITCQDFLPFACDVTKSQFMFNNSDWLVSCGIWVAANLLNKGENLLINGLYNLCKISNISNTATFQAWINYNSSNPANSIDPETLNPTNLTNISIITTDPTLNDTDSLIAASDIASTLSFISIDGSNVSFAAGYNSEGSSGQTFGGPVISQVNGSNTTLPNGTVINTLSGTHLSLSSILLSWIVVLYFL